ncbi:hypothetical protein LVB87_06100 [Lysobacter sp. KIS68-7]|uniref:hypothetical protein n=1 Tax=Lysobacter sp. KIS68-7 TaxID=2904252 RepID=UPI001E311052|nr:hypothetical protein [Lysobacter sp. KIS68-7]UHQ20711.1 hypothetical protein LVB87_06100 [Lysobacter sp. KIS68-7]
MNKHESEIDEREWLAQERARLEARMGGVSDDPLVARYRKVSQALRAPLPDALPEDFAASMARMAQAGVAAPKLAEPDSPFERDLTRLLVGVLGVGAAVVVAVYGKAWLAPTMELLRLDSSVAVNWVLALGACVGATWLTEQLRRHKQGTHAA